MTIATSVNPPSASVCAIAASKGVSTLKCDGTPRQVWSDTRNVSSTHAAVNKPSSRVRERFLSGRDEAISVTFTKVKPNERPNVVGLRSDRGPSHVRPLVSSTARCMTPLRIRTPPVQYATRSMPFISHRRPGLVAIQSAPLARSSCLPSSPKTSYADRLLGSRSLISCQLGELNQVAAGVVQHRNGRGCHVGRWHRELGAAGLDPLVVAFDVIGVEHRRGLALLEDRLLIGLGGGTVVQRQLQLSAVHLLG